MSSELCLIHVESGSQYINIVGSIVSAVYDKVLIALVREVVYASEIVIRRQEGQLVRHFLELLYNRLFTASGNVNLHRLEMSIQNMNTKQVLHNQELVVGVSSVQAVRDVRYKFCNAAFGQESTLEHIGGYGYLVLHLIVHCVKGSTNVRQLSRGKVRTALMVELIHVSNVDKDIFHNFAELKHALLEHSPRVVVQTAVNEYLANAVAECRQELVHKRRVLHQDRTDRTNDFSVSSYNGDIVLIIISRAVANRIQDVGRSRSQRLVRVNSRHCLSLLI